MVPLSTIDDVRREPRGDGWVIEELWVVHQTENLAEKGDGSLAELLGVANVAPNELLKRPVAPALLDFLLHACEGRLVGDV